MVFEYLESKKEKEHDESLINISAIGGCKLKIFLEKKGIYKEEYSTSLKRIFRVGDAFHSLIYNEIIEKSYESGIRIVASEVDVKDEKNKIKGRVDCIISDGRELIVLDIKSCSAWSFDKYQKGEIPKTYIWQIQLYLHILGYKKGILLFVNKNTSKTFEFDIEYNEQFVNEILEEIDKFYKDMENNIPPAVCTSEFPCAACEYYKKNEIEILNKLKEDTKGKKER